MTVFSLQEVALRVGITATVAGLIAYAGLSYLRDPARSSWFREREAVREVVLPAGRRVVGVTWRDGDPWVLTRTALPGEDCSGEYSLARPTGWAITRERFVFREGGTSRDAGAEP